MPDAVAHQTPVQVPLVRLDGWLERFEARHGHVRVSAEGRTWLLAGSDGAQARLEPPGWLASEVVLAELPAVAPEYTVIMIRRAGYAVGRFHGRELLASRVSSRHIHGRTAAGGWSQQRYARRRANQASEIVAATAAAVVALPGGAELLVTGGDRPLLAATLQLVPGPLAGLPIAAHLGVGTPTRATLAAVPDQVLAVRLTVHDPSPAH